MASVGGFDARGGLIAELQDNLAAVRWWGGEVGSAVVKLNLYPPRGERLRKLAETDNIRCEVKRAVGCPGGSP